jgi:hypothetical protein
LEHPLKQAELWEVVMVRRFIAAAVLAGICGLGMPAIGFSQTSTSSDTKQDAKDHLKKAGKATKKAGKSTGEAAKEVGKATKSTAKTARNKVAGTTVTATC